MKKLAMCIVMLVSFLISGAAFAGGQDDSVLSASINEADGTSGQDTNSGSGVKTGHIQDGAVTSQKISDGTVTDAKITGPISGDKLGNHAHSGTDILDGTVTAPKIADGAVTDAKITGLISSSKISSLGLDADTVDGLHASDLAPAGHGHTAEDITGTFGLDRLDMPQNVLLVHKGPANGVSIFNTIQAAIDMVGRTGAPDNPYLILIGPGVYDEDFDLWEYITLRGAGSQNTIITGTGLRRETIRAFSYSSIENLTVESHHTGDPSWWSLPAAISIVRPEVTIRDSVVDGGLGWHAVFVNNYSGTGNDYVRVENSTLIAGRQAALRDANSDAHIEVFNSELIQSATSAYATDLTAKVRIGNTKVDGSISGGGNLKMVNCYDGDYNPILNQ